MSIATKTATTIHGLNALASQGFGLKADEFQVIEEFVFLDGSAITRSDIDAAKLIFAFHQFSVSCNITIVLGMGVVEDEAAFTRKVVDAGGSVAFQGNHQTFKEVVQLNLEVCLAEPLNHNSVKLPASQNEEMKASLSQNYWTLADFAALRQAYLKDSESASILS